MGRVAGNKNGGHQAKVNSSAHLFSRSTAKSQKRKTLRQKDLDEAEGRGQTKVWNLCKEEGEWLQAEGGMH